MVVKVTEVGMVEEWEWEWAIIVWVISKPNNKILNKTIQIRTHNTNLT